MLWSKTFDKEIKEMRNMIREIRRNWLKNKGEICSDKGFNYEYSYQRYEEIDNFTPCTICGEKKGMKKYVTECTSENGKEKGRAFSYCDNCGKSLEFDWDDTKVLGGSEKSQTKQIEDNVYQSSSKNFPYGKDLFSSGNVSQQNVESSKKNLPQDKSQIWPWSDIS